MSPARSRHATLILALCFTLLASAWRVALAGTTDAPNDEPPPGIVPTTVTLSQVLDAHASAAGRLLKSGATVRTEVWGFTTAGAQGTERLVRRGTDYHSRIQTGPFTEEYGQLGDVRWHMNENGAVSDSRREDVRSFEMFRVLEDASDPKNDVKLLGEVHDPQFAYVIEVKRPGFRHPEWIFFDEKTALITRTEEIIGKQRFVSTYDDYQTVRGLTEPSHVHDSDGVSALDSDYRRQSLTFSVSVDESEFSKPAPHESFMRIDRPSDLNARIVYGTVIVRVFVNNRGLDFELSSGDRHSYMDSGVAQELHLPTFGQVTDATGTPVPYETEIADATIGDLHLQHFALEALPFYYHVGYDTKVVGVLGYDFLSQGRFMVDYVNHKVAASPITDAPPDPDIYALPVHFDDGLPFFRGILASHETQNVLLDSSFTFSYVFGGFSQAYPDAVVDAKNGKQHEHAVVPFADTGAYGREFEVWNTTLSDAHIGPTHYFNYRIIATNADMELGGHQVDAVMGTQFLWFYDVYYDFAHNRVFLKPNEYFRKAFKPAT